jgi:hypothetical protein
VPPVDVLLEEHAAKDNMGRVGLRRRVQVLHVDIATTTHCVVSGKGSKRNVEVVGLALKLYLERVGPQVGVGGTSLSKAADTAQAAGAREITLNCGVSLANKVGYLVPEVSGQTKASDIS